MRGAALAASVSALTMGSPPAVRTDRARRTGVPRRLRGRHHQQAEAGAPTAAASKACERLPNYRRILEIGGAERNEESVTRQLRGLLDAGATGIQAFVVPVGHDRQASRRRAMDLPASLAS
ncbi:hypothetical protein [Frankia nepalensis]|uniref:Luciferase-like domain-containing protein n=1 Tax=Frankia nepalensis TaxID=1836974 RepID=A0A937RV56_9ACTN|nr:hypothetical protein [Frankia nepalensis]MBL7495241.1 hypothetical protein [Frankia nepalensis]MBL7516384.1 hypothetical protein [Frankia nepalensis]MBL7632456.1 hypothetical protein [Frankia nepalensis]